MSTIAQAVSYSNYGYGTGESYASRFNWIWAFVDTLENSSGGMVEVTFIQLILAGGLALICCYHACGELLAKPIAVPQRVRDSRHDDKAQPLAAPSSAEG